MQGRYAVNDGVDAAAGLLRNHGREAGRVEAELLRRLSLIGIGVNDDMAVRQLFERNLSATALRYRSLRHSDMLGLALLLMKLANRASVDNGFPALKPATRALLEGMHACSVRLG